MLYSYTHITTVGVKGLRPNYVLLASQQPCPRDCGLERRGLANIIAYSRPNVTDSQ